MNKRRRQASTTKEAQLQHHRTRTRHPGHGLSTTLALQSTSISGYIGAEHRSYVSIHIPSIQDRNGPSCGSRQHTSRRDSPLEYADQEVRHRGRNFGHTTRTPCQVKERTIFFHSAFRRTEPNRPMHRSVGHGLRQVLGDTCSSGITLQIIRRPASPTHPQVMPTRLKRLCLHSNSPKFVC